MAAAAARAPLPEHDLDDGRGGAEPGEREPPLRAMYLDRDGVQGRALKTYAMA
jgi:hypothetical protein